VATAKSALAARSGEVESMRRQLEILLGRYPAAKLQGRSKMPAIGSSPPVGLPSELLLRRPDIIAAERRYAAAGQLIKQGKYAIYPKFPLTASIGTSTSELQNILNSAAGVWSLGVGVTAPIYSGGQGAQELSKRNARERQAIAELQSTVLTAFGEVESALAAERWIVKRIKGYKEALDLAQEAAEAADEDYVNGTGDALTVLTAKRRQIDIASQVAVLRRMRAHVRIDLHLALGVGFDYLERNQNKPTIEPPEQLLKQVRVIESKLSDYKVKVESNGRVTANKRLQLSAEVGGKIVKMNSAIAVGNIIEKDEILFQLDKADYDVALASALSAVADAKLLIEQEEARAAANIKEWKRLGKGEPSNLVQRIPQLESAQARLLSAESAVERARRDLKRTEIKAPYTFTVERKYVDDDWAV